MKKRALSMFLAVIISFLCLSGRLLFLCTSPQKASNTASTRNRTIATSRGMIYDRNMVPFTNTSYSYVALIKPTVKASNHLKSINEDETVISRINKCEFVIKDIEDEKPYSNCSDIEIIKKYNRYDDNLLVHILGYTDFSGQGATGIENHYNDFLCKNSGELNVIYKADAQNKVLLNEDIEIRDEDYYSPAGIILTIDKNIQIILEKALINNGIEKGAGIILDNESGEILACASFPVYDRQNLALSVKDINAPFINRAFSQYPVGSVFKVVTAAAAIENNTLPITYKCTGSTEKTANVFYCNRLDGHGDINFNEALSKSCNTYFIESGVKTGADKLLEVAKKLHLGEGTNFGNGYMTDTGTLPLRNELNFDADIGNLSFGQGRLTATPLQIASIYACLANNGIYKSPTLIKGEKASSGSVKTYKKPESEIVLKEDTCRIINEGLKGTVIDGTGADAYSKILNISGKTSTAQSGQYDENGTEIKYCWFAGFFPTEKPKYTVCIMKENGVSGGTDCGPAFREIAENIISQNL